MGTEGGVRLRGNILFKLLEAGFSWWGWWGRKERKGYFTCYEITKCYWDPQYSTEEKSKIQRAPTSNIPEW